MDGWNGRMDGKKISPFYRTSSPIGAAAPLQGRNKAMTQNDLSVSSLTLTLTLNSTLTLNLSPTLTLNPTLT